MQYIVDSELLRGRQPRGDLAALTLISHGKNGGNYHMQQVALTLGDSLAISESQTGHNRKYSIIGEAHESDANLKLLCPRFNLQA